MPSLTRRREPWLRSWSKNLLPCTVSQGRFTRTRGGNLNLPSSKKSAACWTWKRQGRLLSDHNLMEWLSGSTAPSSQCCPCSYARTSGTGTATCLSYSWRIARPSMRQLAALRAKWCLAENCACRLTSHTGVLGPTSVATTSNWRVTDKSCPMTTYFAPECSILVKPFGSITPDAGLVSPHASNVHGKACMSSSNEAVTSCTVFRSLQLPSRGLCTMTVFAPTKAGMSPPGTGTRRPQVLTPRRPVQRMGQIGRLTLLLTSSLFLCFVRLLARFILIKSNCMCLEGHWDESFQRGE